MQTAGLYGENRVLVGSLSCSTADKSSLCRADYPTEPQPGRTSTARKRQKNKPAPSQQASYNIDENNALVLQLEELGLPSAFGTSKVAVTSCMLQILPWFELAALPMLIGITGLQGEAYEDEDDSCIATGNVQQLQPQHYGNGEREHHTPVSFTCSTEEELGECTSEWQQAYDTAYGCFYYYRERTQVW